MRLWRVPTVSFPPNDDGLSYGEFSQKRMCGVGILTFTPCNTNKQTVPGEVETA
jgi:hypothetical protein